MTISSNCNNLECIRYYGTNELELYIYIFINGTKLHDLSHVCQFKPKTKQQHKNLKIMYIVSYWYLLSSSMLFYFSQYSEEEEKIYTIDPFNKII